MGPGLVGAAALEVGLNALIAADEVAAGRLAGLEGRAVAVELEGLGVALHFVVRDARLQVLDRYAGEVDARISAPPLTLLRTFAGEPAAGAVRIEGQVHVAQALQRLLGALELDWEAWLAGAVGEVAGHQLARVARGLTHWGASVATTLERDLGEYLRLEARALPGAEPVQGFVTAVDALRNDAERLEARLRRIERRLGVAIPNPTPRKAR